MVICSEYEILERNHLNYKQIHNQGVLSGEVGRFLKPRTQKGIINTKLAAYK